MTKKVAVDTPDFDSTSIVRFGAIEMNSASELVFYTQAFNGQPYAHVRWFIKSDGYSGPTRKGIMLSKEQLASLVGVLQQFHENNQLTIRPRELGRIPKNDKTEFVISLVSNRKGEMRLDVRLFAISLTYEGPTKKGVRVELSRLPETIDNLSRMAAHLGN